MKFKVYKEGSIFANKVAQVSDLMNDLGLSLTCLGGSLRFYDDNNHAILIDKDSSEEEQIFPTSFEYELKAFNSEE